MLPERGPSSRSTRIEELFHAALERPEGEREDWLLAETGGDSELYEEVRELLESLKRVEDGGLDRVASSATRLVPRMSQGRIQPGTLVGEFEVQALEQLGGVGSVYRAWQPSLGRVVALKVLEGAASDARMCERFETEAAILARLDHPGLATVLATGTLEYEGEAWPWFAMEFIEGGRAVTRYADEEGLGLGERLDLVREALLAVQYGHGQGVVHRDLKPDNLIVDGKGRPRVIDFGVAKITEGDLVPAKSTTLIGQLVGTPAYMSPEQAAGDGSAIDVRSDVYSMAVVLFELACGERPYEVDGMPLLEALRVVREDPPNESLLAELPRDLAAILRKALHKDPDVRYASCSSFEEDLARFRGLEPVHARPPSKRYELSRFIARNRAVSAALLTAFGCLALGVLGMSWAWRGERERAAEAVAARDEARWGRDFLASLFDDADPFVGEGAGESVSELVTRAVGRLAKSPPPERVAPTMHELLGRVLWNHGRSAEAARELRTAAEAACSTGDAELELRARVRLGLALLSIEDLDGVEDELARARELLLAGAEASDENQVALVSLEGRTLARRGDVKGAVALMERELELWGERLAAEDPVFLSLCSSLGGVLAGAERYKEALPLLRTCAEGRRRVLGEDHAETVDALAAWAAAVGASGDAERAEELLAELYERQCARYGEAHPRVEVILANRAVFLRRLGRLDEAVEASREVYRLRQARLGQGHHETRTSLCNLCIAAAERAQREHRSGTFPERVAEVEAWAEEGLALSESEEFKPLTTDVYLRHTLADLFLTAGRVERAAELYSEARTLAREAWPEGSWRFALLRAGEAGCLAGRGDMEGAIRELEASLARLEELLGAEDPRTQMVAERLSRLR